MDKADLWKARLAVKTLCRDRREAIAGVAPPYFGGGFFLPSRGTLSPCAPKDTILNA